MPSAEYDKYLYEIKEQLVSHTGFLGHEIEKTVAERWIQDILGHMDKADSRGKADGDNKEEINSEIDRAKELLDHASGVRVAIIVYALSIGGAEIFPIHLANALKAAETAVILISCGMAEEDSKVRGLIDDQVPLVRLSHYDQLIPVLQRLSIQVVHTHHAVVDLAVSRAIETGKIGVRQVVTLHGMYEALDKPRRRLLMQTVCRNVSCFAYIADKNLVPFYEIEQERAVPFQKVPNGLPEGYPQPISRSSLAIPEDAFVLCLVSRARWEKGWQEAIAITHRANDLKPSRQVHLILVGDGEAYDACQNEACETIHLVGAQQNTRQYLAASDMGFLPSRYEGESFPLVLIDSFMCGKPVMATSLGEIPTMISTNEGSAGYLCPLTEEGKVNVERMARAVVRLIKDPVYLQRMRACALICAKRYDINGVAQTYQGIYQSVLDGTIEKEGGACHSPRAEILISCHKDSATPHTHLLHPIQVGSALATKRYEHMLYDDVGENISARNRSYCEMTAQYWAWKNVEADYYGFFHYRRYLNLSEHLYREDRYGNVYEPVYSDELIKKYGWDRAHIFSMLAAYDIITVKGRKRFDNEGTPLTVYQQYIQANFLQEKDLQLMMKIVEEQFPRYWKAMERYLQGYTAYYCNMYIVRTDLFREYCAWVFPALEEFCKKADMSGYDEQQLRTPGHLAERLWGIYVTYLKMHGGARIKEVQSVVVAKTEGIRTRDKCLLTVKGKKVVHGVVERRR